MQGYPFGDGDDVCLDLVNVVDESLYGDVIGAEHTPTDEAVRAYLEAEVGRARQELDELGVAPSLQPNLVVKRGRPYPTLIQYAEQKQAYGILIGGQGHGGVGERLLGRTAQRVVRHAAASVYVTRHFRDYARPRRILAAVDESDGARRALELAHRVATATEATFSTICVVETPYVPYLEVFAHEPEIEPYLEKAVGDGFERMVAFEREVLGDLHSTRQSVFTGRVVDSIEMFAQAQHVGTIVVGSHGRTGLPRFLLGSVAEGLATTSRVDVLVAR